MHCTACVWLIERLPRVLPGVIDARVNFTDATVHVLFDPKIVDAAGIAKTIDSFGYSPHPLKMDSLRRRHERSNQTLLLRLAVAGACAGNAMLIAVSLYQGWFSGIETKYRLFLEWVSCGITLPAVVYCAAPFYRTSWAGLRAGIIHIDLPLSLSIVASFLMSAVNTAAGSEMVYYDSLCMLIFLMLCSRWLQRRSIDRARQGMELFYCLFPSSARKIVNGLEQKVFAGSLTAGDEIEARPEETICCDGVLLGEKPALLDLSVLTGESMPVAAAPGDTVFAGARNAGGAIRVRVVRPSGESRLGRLIRSVEEASGAKSKLTESTDRLSAWFVTAVIAISASALAFFWHTAGWTTAFDRALSILLVSCPCALALSSPIALTIAVRSALRHGIFIKEGSAIETAARVKHVYLDKTGTLTEGRLSVVKVCPWSGGFAKEPDGAPKLDKLLAVAASLERDVQHPIASALKAMAAGRKLPAAEIFQELEAIPGRGVRGRSSDGVLWRIGSWSWTAAEGVELSGLSELRQELTELVLTPVVLSRESAPVLLFGLKDAIRAEAFAAVQDLSAMGMELSVLSGDDPEIVRNAAISVGLSENGAVGLVGPERKAQIVAGAPAAPLNAMVGDGLNDAAALSAAGVGIAVCGGAEASLRVAEVFLAQSGLGQVPAFFHGSRKTMRIIYRNFALSICYNIVGVAGALSGWINPLTAAILMPVSSLSVVVSCSSLIKRESHWSGC